MMKLRRINFFALLALCIMMLSSCNHKELCMQHPHAIPLRVEFDWRNAPDANPDGMCVFFYPIDDPDLPNRRYDFTGLTGGEITIQPGRYHVMTYNNDTEASLFKGTDTFHSHECYTREGNIFESMLGSPAYAPRASEAENERVVICPDMIWGHNIMDVEITEDGVKYLSYPQDTKGDDTGTEPQEVNGRVITLFPHDMLCTYTYEIRNVKNLKYITKMCASITGMSPSLILADETLHTECVTLPFGASSDGESRIIGGFLTFGHHEDNVQPHKMVLYTWLVDGSKFYYTFDVTNQVNNAPDRRRVHIIIDGLSLPQPIANGSGFLPSVDDWQVVEETIIM